MPSKIRKRVIGTPFTVNDTTYRTRVGCHEVKSRYGRQTVLVRLDPKREASTALDVANMGEPLRRCTICAVDSRGRFLVEAGGSYVTGAVRNDEEVANICKAERSIYEERKVRKPQLHPALQRKPTAYTRFMAAFLKTFHGVSVADGNVAWGAFSKEAKKNSDVAALIRATTDTGLYPVKAAPS